ncbi:MAG TPA: acyltransferase domain-containing protein, partial [Thermoanaerobaculia bacterium]|nr:acyltransferase domain-containing protein [Thermoanaerobaculia bacterium]
TLQAGRAELEHRGFVVSRHGEEAAEALAAIPPAHLGAPSGPAPPVAFLFPGQGSQHLDMGRELYDLEPRFRADVDLCTEVLGRDLRTAIFPPDGVSRSSAESALEQTELTQPALFTIEYALARLWMSWGIVPQAMLGHSLGELVAATLAGVWSLEDALSLVAERGRLMQSTPTGAMLAVELPEQELAPLLGGGLALASVNAPRSCVASGPADEVEALEADLRELGVESRRLRVSHAFHSGLVAGVLGELEARVRKVACAPPSIPFLSNVTGTWITPEQATDPAYWARQVRSTVRFSPAAAELLSEPSRILLEVGPGRSLSALARRQPAASETRIIPSLPRPGVERGSDLESLLSAAGRLWIAGARLDWNALHADRRPRRIPLPTYPFERQRYWLGEGVGTARPEAQVRVEAELWRQTWASAQPPSQKTSWLLLGDGPLRGELERQLRDEEARVVDQATAEGVLHVISLGEDLEELSKLAGSLGARAGRTEVTAVTWNGCALAGEPAPAAAAVAASSKLADLHPGLRWRTVDLVPLSNGTGLAALARQLLAEAGTPGAEPLVAWRGARRWVRERQPVPETGRLRPRGVYLVLGGLSEPGLSFLTYLAGLGARLIATGPDGTSNELQALEAAGAELLLFPGRRPSLARLVSRARERFGALHGVFDLGGLIDEPPALPSLRKAVAGTEVEFVQVHERRQTGESMQAEDGIDWTHVLWEQPAWSAALPRVLGAGGAERLVVSAPATILPVAPAAPPSADLDEVEAEIANIWQELLGLAAVGTQDDFFALGGDSLLATRVIARMRDRLGVQISLSSALEQPTVSALAAACRRARGESRQDTEISRLLQDVSNLSTEELERMLAHRESAPTTPGDLE